MRNRRENRERSEDAGQHDIADLLRLSDSPARVNRLGLPKAVWSELCGHGRLFK